MSTSGTMQELVLDHAEFLALLEAVQAHRVVGIAETDLFPADPNERRVLVEQGKEALQRRGALQSQGQGELALTPAFEMLARTVAYPQVAITTVREVIGVGPQLFLHYTARGVAVEQTFPQEKVHRLAVIPDIATLVEREDFILSLQDRPTPRAAVEISEDTLRTLKELVDTHQHDAVRALLARHGMRNEEAEALYQTLTNMTFKAEALVLRCGHEIINDVRGLVIWQSPQLTWLMAQVPSGAPIMRIQTTNAASVKQLLLGYIEEFSRT